MEYHRTSKTHSVMNFQEETGTGVTELFEVFPGVYLMFNDFRLRRCRSGFQAPAGLWGVEHCRDGRTEWALENGDFAYLGAGALMPSDYRETGGEFSFPGRYYEGLSVAFDPAEAAVPAALDLDLAALRQRIFAAGVLDLTQDREADAVLGLLYASRRKTDLHRQLALQSFLLFLRELEQRPLEPAYLPRQQADAVKEIEAFLRAHLDRRWTLPELSEAFGLPVSVLRRSFTAVYGVSVADHMRRLRTEQAKLLLVTGELTVGQIASRLGYDNASKFSRAFRSCAGLSPREYLAKTRRQNGAL